MSQALNIEKANLDKFLNSFLSVDEAINDNLERYSMKELIEEVEEYDPELLEEDLLANIGELEATAPDYGVGK